MRILCVLLLGIIVGDVVGQTKSTKLTVIYADSTVRKYAPSRLEAILPNEEEPRSESRKIKFYSRPVPFELRGTTGLLTWFFYTNPPKDKESFYVEADQPSFGSLLYRNKLYVCSPGSIELSIPVINKLLASTVTEALTEAEARSIALLFAKCSANLQIYGNDKSPFLTAEAQNRMEKIAAPPASEDHNGSISVVFYSWSALTAGEVSKWTFLFKGKEISDVKRELISATRDDGHSSGIEGTTLHEPGHASPPKPQ